MSSKKRKNNQEEKSTGMKNGRVIGGAKTNAAKTETKDNAENKEAAKAEDKKIADEIPESIADYNEFKTIDLEKAEFYLTEHGFLALKLDGKDFGRINAYRMFPLSKELTYISLINTDKKEIGIIRDLNELSPNIREYVINDLKRRYFIPEILRFIDIKEEFNYTYFKVETDVGYREVTVHDMNASLLALEDEKLLLTDIDGNKYIIKELHNKGVKALRFLAIWL